MHYCHDCITGPLIVAACPPGSSTSIAIGTPLSISRTRASTPGFSTSLAGSQQLNRAGLHPITRDSMPRSEPAASSDYWHDVDGRGVAAMVARTTDLLFRPTFHFAVTVSESVQWGGSNTGSGRTDYLFGSALHSTWASLSGSVPSGPRPPICGHATQHSS